MSVEEPQPIATRRSGLWTWAFVAALLLTTVVVTYLLFVEAPPPRSIVIAAGAKDGRYHHFATRYAQELQRHGISLEVRETKGTGENLELLSEPGGNVSVALVQGGVADAEAHKHLLALGSLYREPLWIFIRRDLTVSSSTSEDSSRSSEETVRGVVPTRLGQLAQKRIGVGAKGSGTRKVAIQLLEASGVPTVDAKLVDVGGQEAADQLEKGELDAACFVAAIDAGYIQRLGRSPQARLMHLEQQEALTRRFRHLSPVTIPAGLLNLADMAPATPTDLVSPAAMLVVRPTLHPALVSVLLEAATRVHAGGDALASAGEFPSARFVDLPLSPDAERYFQHGPPFLQRILPFWLAAFVDRMKLLALPLLMLGMPLIRATPPLLRWRTRRKIYLWYGQLRQLDHLMFAGMSAEMARSSLKRLQDLEEQVSRVEIPLSYMDEYYNLRTHLNLVHRRIQAILDAEPAPGSAYSRIAT